MPVNGALIAKTARKFENRDRPTGSPKVWDCSGFTRYVFKQHKICLPRVTKDQAEEGDAVVGDPMAGDLVFFDTREPLPNKKEISHVGIALGGDQFIHISTANNGCATIVGFNAWQWRSRFLTARRCT